MQKSKFARIIQELRSENLGKHNSSKFKINLKEIGIEHQLIVLYYTSQNGVNKRKNKTLIAVTRCMISKTNLYQKFWAEAVNDVAYIQNRISTKSHTVLLLMD